MTDSDFKSLRPGDKVSVSGYQIAFDALVTGPLNSLGEIPIQVVNIHRTAEDLDYVYRAYKPGYRTTEQNRSRCGKVGSISRSSDARPRAGMRAATDAM